MGVTVAVGNIMITLPLLRELVRGAVSSCRLHHTAEKSRPRISVRVDLGLEESGRRWRLQPRHDASNGSTGEAAGDGH